MSTDEPSVVVHLALLVAAWLGYFVLHSLLASLAVKRWTAARRPDWMPLYRLGFNALAVLLVLPPLWLTLTGPGPVLIAWTGVGAWIANGLAIAAIAGVLWSLRWYDGAAFLGLRQWRERIGAVADREGFAISPLHRWVRHPWYSLSLVLIWTRDMDPSFLTSAVLLTGYFVVGSRLEERKLIAFHGERYRRYRELVPGLLPLPWRHLTAAQARALSAEPLG
jgi:protein-S-isoprenylcysteine O-methyltransferase Ste14